MKPKTEIQTHGLPMFQVWGDVSKKRLGEMIADMVRCNGVFIVDAREVRSVSGKKVDRSW
jgi:hypothetical protein